MIRPTRFEIVCDGCGEVHRDIMGNEWSVPKNGIESATAHHGWVKRDEVEHYPDCRGYVYVEKHYCPKCRKEARNETRDSRESKRTAE